MSENDLYVHTEGGNIPLRFKLSIGRENERGDVVPLVSMRVDEAAKILLAAKATPTADMAEVRRVLKALVLAEEAHATNDCINTLPTALRLSEAMNAARALLARLGSGS